MMTLGVTEFDETLTIQVVTRAADSYDSNGNSVKGSEADPVDIQADVQPATGKLLQDLPEGVRDEVNHFLWTPYDLQNDHVILFEGDRHRVVKTWRRRSDGFTKAAIGKLL